MPPPARRLTAVFRLAVSPVPTPADPVDRAVERLRKLCVLAVRTMPVTGAGVSVYAQDGTYALLTAADAASERLEETQFVLGQGPCLDATATGRPVLVPDLAGAVPGRWPQYAAAMHEAGIRAIFAFPLQVGAARLGAFDLFRARPGPLSRAELVRAFQLTDEAVTILLALQTDTPEAEEYREDEPADVSSELFQAQGMVMVQLDGTLAEGMARIRAYAFAHNRRLADVARDIVGGRLRFDRDE
jgi:GAF domain-containing protein